MHFTSGSELSFDENTVTIFVDNKASKYGGATFFHSSDMTFDGNSSVRYVNNRAATDGAEHYTDYTDNWREHKCRLYKQYS